MSPAVLLFPVFFQVLLTCVLLLHTGRLRVRAANARVVKLDDVALGEQAWPEKATQAANAFNNQFQLPVLFYVLVILALVLRQQDSVLQVLAWLFVGLRIAHAMVHVTSNNVLTRFKFFIAGFAALAVMWVWFVVKIIAAGL